MNDPNSSSRRHRPKSIFSNIRWLDILFLCLGCFACGYLSYNNNKNSNNINNTQQPSKQQDHDQDANTLLLLQNMNDMLVSMEQRHESTLVSIQELQESLANLHQHQQNLEQTFAELELEQKQIQSKLDFDSDSTATSTPSKTSLSSPETSMTSSESVSSESESSPQDQDHVHVVLPQTRSAFEFSRSGRYLEEEESCPTNLNLFEVEIFLDFRPEETRLSLFQLSSNNDPTDDLLDMNMNMNMTNVALLNETFEEFSPFDELQFSLCLEPGEYLLQLFDSEGDGSRCANAMEGKGCYNVYIDDALIIAGKPFRSSLMEHVFDTRKICMVDNTFRLETQNVQDIGFQLTETITGIRYDFFPDDSNPNHLLACLPVGMYHLKASHENKKNSFDCNGTGPCFELFLNDKFILASASASELFKTVVKVMYNFFINYDDIGQVLKCNNRPLITPINEMNDFIFNDRASRIISVVQSLSDSTSVFSDPASAPYKAICFIMYDDAAFMEPEGQLEFFVERYAMSVLLYATNSFAETNVPMELCDHLLYDCDQDGHIISINLSGAGKKGFIPTEIGHFKRLETLKLDDKQMQGTLPTELAKLTNLQIISLDKNQLTGTIPVEILSEWDDLTSFNIPNNKLKGPIPSELGNLKRLKHIFLESNDFTGSLPTELFRPKNLQDITLNNNHLTGTIPTEIGAARLLTILLLSNNKLTGTIPTEFGNNQFMFLFDLGFNQFTGTIPPEVSGMNWVLSEFRLNDNQLTGTIPLMFPIDEVILNNNSLTGIVPEFLMNSTLNGLKINDNELVGEITQDFCDNLTFVEGFPGVYNLWVDDSPWFIDEPKVICPCCDDANCHMWEAKDIIIVGGTRRPSCPASNSFKRDIFERFGITDLVANVTQGSGIGPGVAGTIDYCLPPTGCYSVKHEIVDGKNDATFSWDREYNVGFNASSRSLEEQETCDAFEICGVSIGPDHPRRMGLNHLTHIVLSDLSFLDFPLQADYQTLCWMMKEDTRFLDYSVCEGTLLQRYVIALFFYSFQISLGFDTLNSDPTCEWPGVTCDDKNQFIEHLDFSDMGLRGTFVTEIGLLTRLKSFVATDNHFIGPINPVTFTYMPNLEVFDVSSNKFGGGFPATLVQLPRIQDIVLSNNLIVGPLPGDIKYSESIKKFDIENNLFTGFIPDPLIACPDLEVINLSRNNLRGNIPSEIGLLDNMREILLFQNSLSGSLPLQMFSLSQIEKLQVQSNGLTGLIPTQVGNLQNAVFISMAHNTLKGAIPKEFETLEKLEFLQLHVNALTGDAPVMPRLRDLGTELDDLERYVTDCGSPWYALAAPLSCPSCTICCNSDEMCQENRIWPIPMEKGAWIYVFGVPILVILLWILLGKIIQLLDSRLQFLEDKRDTTLLVGDDTVYAFIFSSSLAAKALYLGVYFLQGCFYYMFLLASSFTTISSDWQFTYRCPGTSTECQDSSTVNSFGWFMFFVVTLFTLATDYVNSGLQIRKAVIARELPMFISGFLYLAMSVLALFCSYYYNMALATTNTELIVNAVILLFINDLDEQLLDFVSSVAPEWVDEQMEEVQEYLESQFGEPSESEHSSDDKLELPSEQPSEQKSKSPSDETSEGSSERKLLIEPESEQMEVEVDVEVETVKPALATSNAKEDEGIDDIKEFLASHSHSQQPSEEKSPPEPLVEEIEVEAAVIPTLKPNENENEVDEEMEIEEHKK